MTNCIVVLQSISALVQKCNWGFDLFDVPVSAEECYWVIAPVISLTTLDTPATVLPHLGLNSLLYRGLDYLPKCERITSILVNDYLKE